MISATLAVMTPTVSAVSVDAADAREEALDADVLDVGVRQGAGGDEAPHAAADVNLDGLREVEDRGEVDGMRDVAIVDHARREIEFHAASPPFLVFVLGLQVLGFHGC